jgi:hypothetical protein
MKSYWDELRPYVRYLAGFSLLINVLYLAPRCSRCRCSTASSAATARRP